MLIPSTNFFCLNKKKLNFNCTLNLKNNNNKNISSSYILHVSGVSGDKSVEKVGKVGILSLDPGKLEARQREKNVEKNE